MDNDNLTGEILQDVINGKEQPWRKKKQKSMVLAYSLHRLGKNKKGNRVFWCGSNLVFEVNLDTQKKRLKSAEFCRERLCVMCNWRRSFKNFYQVSRVMDVVQERYSNLESIFASFTARNCKGDELSNLLDVMFEGWYQLTKHYKFQKIIQGWFRALEVTYDGDEYITKKRYQKGKGYYDRLGLKPGDKNPNYDTFHPHFHVILLVDKQYFKGKDYMRTEDWVKMWRTAGKFDYDPVCDVRKIKPKAKNKYKTVGQVSEKSLKGAVAEVAKYTLKDTDYLHAEDNELTDRLVQTLGDALHGRRLFAFGGVMKKIAKELEMDDSVDGDLVNIDDTKIREDVAGLIEIYQWDFGLLNYFRRKDLEE